MPTAGLRAHTNQVSLNHNLVIYLSNTFQIQSHSLGLTLRTQSRYLQGMGDGWDTIQLTTDNATQTDNHFASSLPALTLFIPEGSPGTFLSQQPNFSTPDVLCGMWDLTHASYPTKG